MLKNTRPLPKLYFCWEFVRMGFPKKFLSECFRGPHLGARILTYLLYATDSALRAACKFPTRSEFRKRSTRLLLILSLCLCIFIGLLTSCTDDAGREAIPEVQESYYRKGRQALKEGQYQAARQAFLKVVQKRAEAPESHLELGSIYLDRLKDPVMAIYHFRAHLNLKPHTEQTTLVQQLIKTAEKQFAKQLPGNPYESELDRAQLMDALEQLHAENCKLKNDLAALQKATVRSEALPQVVTASGTMPLSSPRQTEPFYTVTPGDTLSSISIRVYGTPVYWKAIYEANQPALKSPNDLKIGQVLKLPQ